MEDINKDLKILEEFTESSWCLTSQEEIIECVKNLIKGYRELEEYYEEQNEVNAKFIPKSKIKEFFTSRLEKYQEADDGAYEQDYLTRGELELVDRYKECKEIAKILLEEEIEAEIPQDCIPKSKVEEKIEELKQYKISLLKEDYVKKQKEFTSQNVLVCNAIRDIATTGKIEVLQELLEKRK